MLLYLGKIKRIQLPSTEIVTTNVYKGKTPHFRCATLEYNLSNGRFSIRSTTLYDGELEALIKLTKAFKEFCLNEGWDAMPARFASHMSSRGIIVEGGM